MSETRAIVLLSGGIDSTVCLALADEEKRRLYGVFFDYGQRQVDQERDAVFAIAEHFIKQGTYTGFELLDTIRLDLKFARTEGSSMLNPGVEINEKSMLIPGRNLLFLTHAMIIADAVDANEIWIGANSDDAVWTDCQPYFFAQVRAISYSALCGHRSIQIRTPLLNTPKSVVVKLARVLDVPLHLTWSCYDPQSKGIQRADQEFVVACNKCPACILRNAAGVDISDKEPT